MHVGIQLLASEGCDCLAKDRIYHFVRNDQVRVLLIDFGEVVNEDSGCPRKPPRQMAKLHIMKAVRFEGALISGEIRVAPDQSLLPPWLAPVDGLNIEAIDLRRMKGKLEDVDPELAKQDGAPERDASRVYSHIDRIDQRERILQNALDNSAEILAAHDPCLELNRYARAAVPRQNETRFRLQFWVKLCFPRSRWALLSPFCRIGHWDRASEEHKDTKFGRPANRYGKLYGSPGSDPKFVKRIEDSYWLYQREGKSMRSIYDVAMRKEFGCLSLQTPEGKGRYFVHPKGEPFPTPNQFMYRCYKAIGKDLIRSNLWGDIRVRNRHSTSRGRYSQAVANLMERTSIDVTKNPSIPVGLDKAIELPPLCSAEMVCEASGMIAGVGFSLGDESNTAYRYSMFCAAIGKPTFGRIIGMSISEEEWPGQGLPPDYHSDRGPGARTWKERSSDAEPAIRSMAPSHTPQSNATAESVHQKQAHIDGPPTRLVSRLNPVQMLRQSVYRIISQNNTRDASDRMTPEMFAAGVVATPVGIWNYLEKRCRTVAQPMSFDEAVRSFLDPVEFTFDDGRLKLVGATFSSPELQDWISRDAGTVKGFVMELAVRYAWVDVGTHLIEVEAQLPLRDDDEQIYLSLTELHQLARMRCDAKNDLKWSRAPTSSYYKDKCNRDVGEPWDGSKRKPGSAKPRAESARNGSKPFKRSRA